MPRYLPKRTIQATLTEVRDLIERERLYGLGCGLVDLSLLASTMLMRPAKLWTLDKNLAPLPCVLASCIGQHCTERDRLRREDSGCGVRLFLAAGALSATKRNCLQRCSERVHSVPEETRDPKLQVSFFGRVLGTSTLARVSDQGVGGAAIDIDVVPPRTCGGCGVRGLGHDLADRPRHLRPVRVTRPHGDRHALANGQRR